MRYTEPYKYSKEECEALCEGERRLSRKRKIDEACELLFSLGGCGRKPLTPKEKKYATKRLKEVKQELGIKRLKEVVVLNKTGTAILRYVGGGNR